MREENKLSVIMIIEVIGKPPEHLTETLNEIVKKISEEKGVEVKDKKLNDPVTLKENQQFYTSFAEIEAEIDGIAILSELMFRHMPAHVEILSPEHLRINNNELNDIFNSLMRKLHGYDEVARIIQTEKILLQREIKKLKEEKKLNGSEDSKKD